MNVWHLKCRHPDMNYIDKIFGRTLIRSLEVRNSHVTDSFMSGCPHFKRQTFIHVTYSTYSVTTHCSTLQHTATHCNTLQHTATHFIHVTYATYSVTCKFLTPKNQKFECHIIRTSHPYAWGIVCVCVCVSHVTWLIHLWRDSLRDSPWSEALYVCVSAHSQVWGCVCVMAHSHIWGTVCRGSFTYLRHGVCVSHVIWLIHRRDMTRLRDSLWSEALCVCVSWHIHKSEALCVCVSWHIHKSEALCVCASWLIHKFEALCVCAMAHSPIWGVVCVCHM